MVNRYSLYEAQELVEKFKNSVDEILDADYANRIAVRNSPGLLQGFVKKTDESDQTHALDIARREIAVIATEDAILRRGGNLIGHLDSIMEKYEQMGIPSYRLQEMISERAKKFSISCCNRRDSTVMTLGYAEAVLEDAPLVYGELIRRRLR